MNTDEIYFLVQLMALIIVGGILGLVLGDLANGHFPPRLISNNEARKKYQTRSTSNNEARKKYQSNSKSEKIVIQPMQPGKGQKLMPLSNNLLAILNRLPKQSCGKEEFYIDENSFTYPVLVSKNLNNTRSTVIVCEKFKVEGGVTLYSGRVPSEDGTSFEWYMFAQPIEIESWLKQVRE